MTRDLVDTELVELTRVKGLPGGSFAVKGFSSIDFDVAERAAYIAYRILAEGDQEVVERMAQKGCKMVIIAEDSHFTDLPGLESMKGQQIEGQPGRSYDDLEAQSRPNYEGGPACIFTEQNVMNPVQKDPHYWNECAVIHEFAHIIQMAGFSQEQNDALVSAHQAALNDGEDPSLYMYMNEREFWANGTQAWFDAIGRTDVNDGVNSRDLIYERFPDLALLMEQVYGDSNDYQYNGENRVW